MFGNICENRCSPSRQSVVIVLCVAVVWLILFQASSFPSIQNFSQRLIKSSSRRNKETTSLPTLATKLQDLTNKPIKRNASSEICPERYLENDKTKYPYRKRYNAWIRENCSFAIDVGQLVTVLVNFRTGERGQVELTRLAESLKEAYPSVRILVGMEKSLNLSIEGIEIVSTVEKSAWGDLLKLCKTKYVMLGFDLDYVSTWINLHRGIRLLGQGTTVVGGAVRNSTGHWSIPCYQVALRYYRLELKEGYSTDLDDCMVCNYVGGPLLMAKEKLKQVKTDLPESIMMLDWSLRTTGEWLACPDIMYQTHTSIGKDAERAGREVWGNFANIWEMQGVVTEWRPRFKEVFSCKEVGLRCDAPKQSMTNRLQTWCCHQSFQHVLGNLERLAVEHGLEYEISDGTMLGAIKMGNYMPWDIDVDIDYNKKQIKSYQAGGIFEVWLKREGISIEWDSKRENMILLYQGLKVELWCNNENMSRRFIPEYLRHSSTRILMGENLWLRTFANPGLAARGRYGPFMLHHRQSWLCLERDSSLSQYYPGDWKKCEVPGHHACLSNYPTVGNIGLLPNNYP